MYELDEDQKTALKSIVHFILNVYAPVFMKTNLTPRLPDGPDIILLTRDLMKDFGVPDRVKNIFLDHAVTWMSPTNVAVVVHKESPPILANDVRSVRVLTVNTRQLCWGKKGIRAFFTVESGCAPCMSTGDSHYWRSMDNHNRVCERYIGKMGLVFKEGWVKDSMDGKVDRRVRWYVLSQESVDSSQL